MTETDRAGQVQQQQPEPFVKFPKWLLGTSDPYEKAVLLALLSHGGSIFPSHRVLAEEAGCSITKLKTVLVEMRKKGWISWQERFDTKGQISNFYTLHLGNLEWAPPSRDTATQVATTKRPGSHAAATPQARHGYEQDSINKTQLTRETPLTPQRGAAPASKSKRLTAAEKAEKKAQTLISWIDGIPPEFAGRKEQISKWLEARYDQPKNKPQLKRDDGFDPWGPNQLSAGALREMISIDGRIADKYLLQAAQQGWGSLGHSGFKRLMQSIAKDLGLAKDPRLANNGAVRPGPPVPPMM